ncbi:ASCH domain-containing protein [Synechocystis salina LEGE 00031]|uniref:ASCH domain-containing protein n=2 Tax=Synechocystis TaxID=1142 RepID=A0ABR9VS19_9SYNC|nr:ASCH domain-containing protein [Synechocystis salina LEGE 00041]MBE9254117.1 ASCH domain-containing protein [Synechocystis salina LEGE 00031]
MRNEQLERYWQTYMAGLSNTASSDEGYEAHQFGDSSALADELSNLVLEGTKTATCSALWEWEAEGIQLPEIGAKTIVLNGSGEPTCIIETTEIMICPFSGVDARFAYEEGENDRSLESWRKEHWQYFLRVLLEIGKEPTPEMLLVCERFRVVYI